MCVARAFCHCTYRALVAQHHGGLDTFSTKHMKHCCPFPDRTDPCFKTARSSCKLCLFLWTDHPKIHSNQLECRIAPNNNLAQSICWYLADQYPQRFAMICHRANLDPPLIRGSNQALVASGIAFEQWILKCENTLVDCPTNGCRVLCKFLRYIGARPRS